MNRDFRSEAERAYDQVLTPQLEIEDQIRRSLEGLDKAYLDAYDRRLSGSQTKWRKAGNAAFVCLWVNAVVALCALGVGLTPYGGFASFVVSASTLALTFVFLAPLRFIERKQLETAQIRSVVSDLRNEIEENSTSNSGDA